MFHLHHLSSIHWPTNAPLPFFGVAEIPSLQAVCALFLLRIFSSRKEHCGPTVGQALRKCKLLPAVLVPAAATSLHAAPAPLPVPHLCSTHGAERRPPKTCPHPSLQNLQKLPTRPRCDGADCERVAPVGPEGLRERQGACEPALMRPQSRGRAMRAPAKELDMPGRALPRSLQAAHGPAHLEFHLLTSRR